MPAGANSKFRYCHSYSLMPVLTLTATVKALLLMVPAADTATIAHLSDRLPMLQLIPLHILRPDDTQYYYCYDSL
jgi:hypothetical protein